MGLEALELAERREGRVGIAEVGDEAEVKLTVFCVVGEASARGVVVERVAEVVVDAARMVAIRRQLPHFLDAEAVELRPGLEPEAGDEPLGE